MVLEGRSRKRFHTADIRYVPKASFATAHYLGEAGWVVSIQQGRDGSSEDGKPCCGLCLVSPGFERHRCVSSH